MYPWCYRTIQNVTNKFSISRNSNWAAKCWWLIRVWSPSLFWVSLWQESLFPFQNWSSCWWVFNILCVHRRSNPFGESGDSKEDSQGTVRPVRFSWCFLYYVIFASSHLVRQDTKKAKHSPPGVIYWNKIRWKMNVYIYNHPGDFNIHVHIITYLINFNETYSCIVIQSFYSSSARL